MKTFLLVMGLVLAGCGNSQDGGVECMTNPDCDPGLSCIGVVAVGASGTCAATGKKVCTKQCVGDTDCLKSVPVCQTGCGGLKTCGVAAK